jgi:hypothetical protein
MTNDDASIKGKVTVELFDKDGNLKFREVVDNLVTAVGDQMYASRGVGLTTSALPLGMKLGTGTTAASKTGAGAALVTYLANSQQAFDATYPSVAGGVVTYKVSYAAGKATSAATAITEVVLYTDATADATSSAANTIARAILSTVPSKQSTDTLAITWTHTLLGS